MKAVVAAFNQEKALVGAFSVFTNLRMELFQALLWREFNSNNVVFAASSQNRAVNVNIFQNSEFFRDLNLST